MRTESAGWTAAAMLASLFLAPAGGAAQEAGPSGGPMAERAEGRNGMVAAAHPLAARAGADALREGGNAVDAAVATAMVLGVVEPMMAGIGGGGSMTVWIEDPGRAEHVEFYASGGAEPDHALDSLHWPAPPARQVAIPGTVQGLWEAHREHGALAWERLVEPAVRIARDGFPVHTLLARVIAGQEEKLTRTPEVGRIYYPGGEPLQAGDLLVQEELAGTLERIAREGRDGFYRGRVAETIVRELREEGNPLTTDDFADFEARWRRPVCGTYRGHTVLSAPPPLAGVEVVETLEILEGFDVPALGPPASSPDALAALVGSIRAARADRGRWIGSPDEGDVGVPAARMGSEAYAAARRRVATATPVPESVEAGDPWAEGRAGLAPECGALRAYPPTDLPRPGEGRPGGAAGAAEPSEAGGHTSHFSIVDSDGNAVSMTFTMGFYFGSGEWVDGTFLNSAALNFGGRGANRRAPGATPASSTTPTIVLDGDDVRLVVGSPGSGRIPPAIVHTIVYTLDLGLDPAEAVRMPRAYPSTGSPTVQIESGFSAGALAALRERGYRLAVEPPFDNYFGGVHAVLVREDGVLVGAADPRRDGAAAGY